LLGEDRRFSRQQEGNPDRLAVHPEPVGGVGFTGDDFVDAAGSALPAEVDLDALPRWMKSVPEQRPPEELEFEAGSGPASDWD
jgi:hypothetical protein